MTALLLSSATPAAGAAADASAAPEVITHTSQRPAGTLKDGTLVLNLRAGQGIWRPEQGDGPALAIEAFGEIDGPLVAPAPLIRAPEGTEIVATVRNDLAAPLQVHGLCEHTSGVPCATLDVPPSGARTVRFRSGGAGTYLWWASTTGVPLAIRHSRDTQLSGAFIAAIMMNPKFTTLINGLSWPNTERLTYRVGEAVRWRIVNASAEQHTMHLHGFFFDVDSLGDGMRDTRFAPDRKPRVMASADEGRHARPIRERDGQAGEPGHRRRRDVRLRIRRAGDASRSVDRSEGRERPLARAGPCRVQVDAVLEPAHLRTYSCKRGNVKVPATSSITLI